MASICFDIGCLYEILGKKEKSRYYYQKIVDKWNANPEKIPYHTCANAFEALGRPVLIYAGLSYYSYKLSEAYYHFWRPHYLQEGADLCEKAELYERLRIYNRRGAEAWEKMKDNIGRSLHSIEEAWLFEEVGYIYEKAGEFEKALEYYKMAEAKYRVLVTLLRMDTHSLLQVSGREVRGLSLLST